MEGEFVRLEPATPDHAADLATVVAPDTFQYYVTLVPESLDESGIAGFIQRAWALPNTIPFAVIDKSTGRAIGMSSYLDIRPFDRALEIGMTWYAPEYRGTKINPEAKLLMLRHAFEDQGAGRVQLKCDSRNLASRAAILKLGAVQEGILRKHMAQWNGYIRDTVMFSIIESEWPAVKAGLEARLAAR